jgi:hypothetical protein
MVLPTSPRDNDLQKAIKAVRSLLKAFPESWEQDLVDQNLDMLEAGAANIAIFSDSLAELAAVPNGLYLTVALAGGVLHWASNETGRSIDEILSLLENDLDS